MVVLGPDGKSIRVFEARLQTQQVAPDYYRAMDASAKDSLFMDSGTGSEWNFSGCAINGKQSGSCLRAMDASAKDSLFMDSGTGSEWNFSGCAINGKQSGSCLRAISALKDYWFDWRNYHPDTTIFRH